MPSSLSLLIFSKPSIKPNQNVTGRPMRHRYSPASASSTRMSALATAASAGDSAASHGTPANSADVGARERASRAEAEDDRVRVTGERPMRVDPRIVVRPTTQRQTSGLASRSRRALWGESHADHLPATDVEPREAAARRTGAAREELRHLADHHLVATRRAGAAARVRARRRRL